MNILNISNYYEPHTGGIEQVARDITNSISDTVNVKVFCFESGLKNDSNFVDNVEVIRTKCFAKISSQSLSFEYGRKLSALLKNFRPDVVVFHFPNPFGAHFLLKYLKHSEAKLVIWWHLDITKQKILKKFFEKQTLNLLEKATKIVATSPNYLDGSPFLKKYKDKTCVIPNCVTPNKINVLPTHLERSQSIKREFTDKKICFAMGRHVEYKGLEYLIKASKLLNSSYVIFIAGEGKLTKRLKQIAKDDNKVIFLGKINDDEAKSYMLASDIFCFPSITKNEAFGLALAEAMSFGKPAITFTIEGSGVNYVSINNKTGIEVPNRDFKAFACAIDKLGSSEQLLQEYGTNAKLRALDLFSYETFKNNVKSLIQKLWR